MRSWQKTENPKDWRRFLVRRGCRIIPMYALTLLAISVLIAVQGDPATLTAWRATWGWTVALLTNSPHLLIANAPRVQCQFIL